jgi:hypothetical protein
MTMWKWIVAGGAAYWLWNRDCECPTDDAAVVPEEAAPDGIFWRGALLEDLGDGLEKPSAVWGLLGLDGVCYLVVLADDQSEVDFAMTASLDELSVMLFEELSASGDPDSILGEAVIVDPCPAPGEEAAAIMAAVETAGWIPPSAVASLAFMDEEQYAAKVLAGAGGPANGSEGSDMGFFGYY